MLGIDRRAVHVIWTLFLAALILSIVYYVRATILLLAVSVFFAYMLSPVVGLVERFVQKRRGLALAVVYVVLVGALVLLGFELIPRFASQATSLVTRLPALVSSGTIANFPLPQWLKPLHDQIVTTLNNEAKGLQSSVVPFLQKAGTQILSGIGAILPIILVPILAFFFLKDGRGIRNSFLSLFEDFQSRGTAKLILNDVHLVLRNYIRALVLLAIASFACWFLFLSVMHYSYELLLAGLAGILEFIPVIGPAAALLIMVVVTLVTGSGGVLWIIVFWGCFRIFQDYVLNPYLMSSGIELHPLLVLIGVLAGEQLGGVPGMFFSVPVIAIVRVIYSHLRSSEVQASSPAPPDDDPVTSTADYRPSTSVQTPAYTSSSRTPARPIPPVA